MSQNCKVTTAPSPQRQSPQLAALELAALAENYSSGSSPAWVITEREHSLPIGNGLLKRSTQGVSLGNYVSGRKGEEVKRYLFQKIGWLSLILRQARVTLDCFSIGNNEPAAEAGFSKKLLRRKSESRNMRLIASSLASIHPETRKRLADSIANLERDRAK